MKRRVNVYLSDKSYQELLDLVTHMKKTGSKKATQSWIIEMILTKYIGQLAATLKD